jgi:hypothetical protein
VGLREPPLEEGYQRVRWKNVCSPYSLLPPRPKLLIATKKRRRMFYDDYIEREPGALEGLRQYLNGSMNRSTSGDARPGSSLSVSRVLFTPQDSVSRASSRSSNDGNRTLTNQVHRRHNGRSDDTPAQDDVELGISSGPLHLFTCIERGRHKIDLRQQLITDISHDRELFLKLQKRHRKYRGRLRTYWSPRTVHSIHFMKASLIATQSRTWIIANEEIQFTYGGPRHIDPRCHDDLCDRSKSCDCIPPKDRVTPTGIEYQCSPVPAKQSPPVGPRLMMDYFTDLHGIDLDLTFVLN